MADLNLQDGTVRQAWPYQGVGRMLRIDIAGREVWQTTMADIRPRDMIQVAADGRIYQDGEDVTFTAEPVTLTGVLRPGADRLWRRPARGGPR